LLPFSPIAEVRTEPNVFVPWRPLKKLRWKRTQKSVGEKLPNRNLLRKKPDLVIMFTALLQMQGLRDRSLPRNSARGRYAQEDAAAEQGR
jgi:hypothetical protein